MADEMNLGGRMSVTDYGDSFKGKMVLVRVDYNVPLDDQGRVTSNQRIAATLPTINFILGKGAAKVILMSHLARPDGRINMEYSLKPVASELEGLLGKPVIFLSDCVGDQVQQACLDAPEGSVILLENLRFHPEEEGSGKLEDGTKVKADPEKEAMFRSSLSSLGDVYVNDAFGAVHRGHSSISGISIEPRLAGLLVQKELEAFSKLLDSPDRIDVAILGGAKVSDKIQLILHLLAKVKTLVIGGAMAFTLLKEHAGMAIGASLYDAQGAELVGEIFAEATKQGVAILLPEDFVIADAFKPDAKTSTVSTSDGIPAGWLGLDIGPASASKFASVITEANSIIWNGPMGVFEWQPFESGTKAVLDAMLQATRDGALTIVGGGDSATAVAKWSAQEGLSHVSTGGGASIELLEGRALPGITALSLKSS